MPDDVCADCGYRCGEDASGFFEEWRPVWPLKPVTREELKRLYPATNDCSDDHGDGSSSDTPASQDDRIYIEIV